MCKNENVFVYCGDLLVRFEIPGLPKGKGRPRFNRATGAAYTPDSTASYENLVKVLAMKAFPFPPCNNAVGVTVYCYTPMPKTTPKKILEALQSQGGQCPSTKRPDLDNVVKAITDGMNGVVYSDDALITYLYAVKFLVSPREAPRVVVLVHVAERLTEVSPHSGFKKE